MYGIRCDRCGAQFVDLDSDYSVWADEGHAWSAAEDKDWIMQDGKHYCPCCYEYDEDKDEIVAKPPYPQCFHSFRDRTKSILPFLDFSDEGGCQSMSSTYSEKNRIPVDTIGLLAWQFGLGMKVERGRYGNNLIFTVLSSDD